VSKPLGYVINGKYVRADEVPAETVPRKHPLHAAHELDRAREDFRRDFTQPYLASGDPNPEFVKAFPEESKQYFSDEQLKEMERP
jgi:hypothetical protein